MVAGRADSTRRLVVEDERAEAGTLGQVADWDGS
jgi:hypothetical protein